MRNYLCDVTLYLWKVSSSLVLAVLCTDSARFQGVSSYKDVVEVD